MKTLLLFFFVAFAAFAQVRDTYPRTPPTLTVAAMTALSSPPTNMRVTVSDGANSTDCTTGGGSTVVDCRYTGSAWTAVTGAGSGGGGTVLFGFWETSGMAQALTRYVTIGSDTGHTSESSRQQNLPRAGTVSKLYIRTITNVGGTAQTFIATVRKNGVDTSITCTINTGSNTCNDTSNSVSFAAGDLFSVKYVTSATETAVLYPSFTLTLE